MSELCTEKPPARPGVVARTLRGMQDPFIPAKPEKSQPRAASGKQRQPEQSVKAVLPGDSQETLCQQRRPGAHPSS